MSDFDFKSISKRFLLGESHQKEPSISGYIHALGEILSNITTHTQSDQNRLEMATESLKGIKRHFRRLNEQIRSLEEKNTLLEEKLRVLEEGKEE